MSHLAAHSTSAAKAHELCAKNAAHVVTASPGRILALVSASFLSPPLVTAVNLSVSHYATAS